jgi:NHL repeat-containing protein
MRFAMSTATLSLVTLIAGGCAASGSSTAAAPTVPAVRYERPLPPTASPAASRGLEASPIHAPALTVTNRIDPATLGIARPVAVAMAADGSLFMTDITPQVDVISPEGKLVRRWGRKGTAPGEFRFEFETDSPQGGPGNIHGSLAIGPDGLVYVADAANDRIQVFAPDGTYVREFGRWDNGRGLASPYEIALDQDGNAYVTDDADNRFDLRKFSAAGEPLWNLPGGPFHFSGLDPSGRVVLATESDAVLYVSTDGKITDRMAVPGPCGASVDGSGHVYVDLCESGLVVFDGQHREIARFATDADPLAGPPHFGPHGEAFGIGRDGSIVLLSVTVS